MNTRPGGTPRGGARHRGNPARARSNSPYDSATPTPTPTSTPLRFGYGTNGLADLRLDDALGLLADLGYDGVGLTLDHMHLDPLAPDLPARTRQLARRLNTLGLGVTVETGARYLLDPRRKHGPSLLDPDPDDRRRRVDLLLRAVRVAADLGAHAVHCFSGITPAGTDQDTAWHRLTDALAPVLDAATAAGIPLAVEPEPGQLLATIADFHHLRHALDDPEALGLTLDIGHCQCLEPLPPADCVRAAAPWLRHVQIEDMRRGIHEHLPFGNGEIDFPPVLAALSTTGYQGLTVVELPRHSHAGPHYAEHSLRFLRRTAPAGPPPSGSQPKTAVPTATTPRPVQAPPPTRSTATSPTAVPAASFTAAAKPVASGAGEPRPAALQLIQAPPTNRPQSTTSTATSPTAVPAAPFAAAAKPAASGAGAPTATTPQPTPSPPPTRSTPTPSTSAPATVPAIPTPPAKHPITPAEGSTP